MAQLKVFTLENLTQYDGLIKGYINAADAKSIKTVAIDGNTLKFYRVSEPVGETAPAYEITLPDKDISHLMSKLNGATVGNVVTVAANGEVSDGGVALADLATKTEVSNVDKKADKNATDIAAINNAETGILKQGKDYTDAQVKALTDGAVKTNADDIDALEGRADALETTVNKLDGADTVVGSVKAQIKEAKAELEQKITNSMYNDTQVKADIAANAKAIEDEAARADAAEKANKALIDANAEAIDEINNEETGILKQGKNYTDSEVATVQGDVDDLEEVVAGMYTNDQIDKAISDAQTAATYDDTEVKAGIKANSDAIAAHKELVDAKVTTLIGDDADKSVRTIANEELVKQLIPENAKESLDKLEEIAAWIQSHPDDASAMNKAIEDLTALVGTLPEGVTATTIAGYIAEVVAAEKARAEGVEGGLDTRLQTVEAAIGEGGSVDTQITNKIAELDADVTSAAVEAGKGVQVQVTEVDGKVTTVVVTGNYDNAYDAKGAAATAKTEAMNAVTALETGKIKDLEDKVGDGWVAIPEADINALFA